MNQDPIAEMPQIHSRSRDARRRRWAPCADVTTISAANAAVAGISAPGFHQWAYRRASVASTSHAMPKANGSAVADLIASSGRRYAFTR